MQEVQSDRILDLVESAIKVESEIETHTEEVADRLGEDFEPIQEGREEGQTKPDFRATLTALKDTLGHSREQLSLAEKRQIDLVKQAIELRDERQELTSSLYDDFSSMRRSVEELYRGRGKDRKVSAFVVAGVQGPTAQGPAKLLRQIDLAVEHLRQPGLEFPKPRFGGTPLKPRQLVRAFQPRAQRLDQVLAGLHQVGSEMNASRKERSRAIDRHKSTFLWVARAAEAYFQLAGEHELAARIRPSARRPGRRAAEVAGGPSTTEASSTEASSTEASAEAGSGEPESGEAPAGAIQPTGSPAAGAASELEPSPPSDG